jgi:hypothetical protein
MINEQDVRQALRSMVLAYGRVNITEVKEQIHLFLELDSSDLRTLKGRKDGHYTQKVRNLTSHAPKTQKFLQANGMGADFTKTPAEFFSLTGLTAQQNPISKINSEQAKEKFRKFRATIVDWDKVRERNQEIGLGGENFVLEHEKDRVAQFDTILSGQIIHLSQKEGDGAGYDISSFNEDGTRRSIEVKTTTSDASAPFYMTKNEKCFFEIYQEEAFIYRVYNFDRHTGHGDLLIITAEELLRDYKFDPTTFAVTKKTNK